MQASPDSTSPTAAHPTRVCYCGSLSPAYLQEHKIPEGFCGICERCGQPGHTQHFPGPVPYTGAWCDACLPKVAFYWRLKAALFLVVIGGLVALLAVFLS
jgi:uncharacterized membrane protein